MKELRSLDSLRAVAMTLELGSPSRAARVLRRAPSSVYRALERLEKEVGAPLFRRSKSSWTATDIGRSVAKLAEQIESDVAKLELSVLRKKERLPTPFRISASDAFASYLTPVIAAMIQSRPDVRIELVVDNNLVDLARREADLAIRPDMRPGNGLIGQRAGKLAHALYGSRLLIERQGEPASLDDLAGYPACALTPDLPHFTSSSWWKQSGLARALDTLFIANTELCLAAAVADGVGLGVLPCFVGDRLEGVQRISTIRISDPVDIWLVTSPALSKNVVVRSILRTLAASIRADARLFSGSRR